LLAAAGISLTAIGMTGAVFHIVFYVPQAGTYVEPDSLGAVFFTLFGLLLPLCLHLVAGALGVYGVVGVVASIRRGQPEDI